MQNASLIYNLSISVHNNEANSSLFLLECPHHVVEDLFEKIRTGKSSSAINNADDIKEVLAEFEEFIP